MCFVGEVLLLDERVGVQPVDELRAESADDARLHVVDVGVDESRGDDPVGVVIDMCALGQRVLELRVRADRRDDTALDDDQPIRVLDEHIRLQERISGHRDDVTADRMISRRGIRQVVRHLGDPSFP